MASYSKFQTDAKKNSTGRNSDVKIKKVDKSSENSLKDVRMRTQMKKWTSFYRLNLHRFIEHYFEIDLFFFQKILLFFMNLYPSFMLVASRGLSKSYMIAVFACAKCTLYPGTKVVIASGVKKQASLIITEKIEKELMQYPNLAREIKTIKQSNGEVTVIFYNGSSIVSTVSNENARGLRANMLILEEFRLIKEDILNDTLLPFLNVYRQPPYLKKPEYSHLTEENVEIYISSAWYTNHWMWKSMNAFKKDMLEKGESMIFSLDYLTSIHHGLLSKKRIEKIKRKSDFDATSFMIEYENIMFFENNNAYFKLDDIEKNRKIKKAFYPIPNMDYHELKNKRKEKLKDGEIRVMGVDVALMGGKNNDASIVTCMRLIPNGDHYLKKVVYIEQIEEAGHTDDQAIRIKQIFEDFQASYVALDANGNGMAIYDSLVTIQYDEERDVEYDAWTAYNDEEMAKRAKSNNPLPVIMSVKAYQRTNHDIATSLRTGLQNGIIEFLIDDIEAKETMSSKAYYDKADPYQKAMYEMPYKQTTAMQNELINLDHEIVGGYVKIKEKSTKRKDRYSSLAYCNYLAKSLESKLSSDENYDEDDDIVYFVM